MEWNWKDIVRAMWLGSGIKAIIDWHNRCDELTHVISNRGLEIINNPVLLKEANRQIQEWKDSGSNGLCVIDLSKVMES